MMSTIPNLPKYFAGDVYVVIFILSYIFSKYENRFETRLHSVTNKEFRLYPFLPTGKIPQNHMKHDVLILLNT